MALVWPAREYLPGYVDALERGWSADNLRGEAAAREELARIAADPDGFLASLVDREAAGGPIALPDGTTVPRLPGYVRWIWDGEFCGSVGFRWQPGTEALPPTCLALPTISSLPARSGRFTATGRMPGMPTLRRFVPTSSTSWPTSASTGPDCVPASNSFRNESHSTYYRPAIAD